MGRHPRWFVPNPRDVPGGEKQAAQGRREGQYRRDIGPTEDAAMRGFAAAAPPRQPCTRQWDVRTREDSGDTISMLVGVSDDSARGYAGLQSEPLPGDDIKGTPSPRASMYKAFWHQYVL